MEIVWYTSHSLTWVQWSDNIRPNFKTQRGSNVAMRVPLCIELYKYFAYLSCIYARISRLISTTDSSHIRSVHRWGLIDLARFLFSWPAMVDGLVSPAAVYVYYMIHYWGVGVSSHANAMISSDLASFAELANSRQWSLIHAPLYTVNDHNSSSITGDCHSDVALTARMTSQPQMSPSFFLQIDPLLIHRCHHNHVMMT